MRPTPAEIEDALVALAEAHQAETRALAEQSAAQYRPHAEWANTHYAAVAAGSVRHQAYEAVQRLAESLRRARVAVESF